MSKPLKLTAADIEAGKSPAGGFTRKQLHKWSVHWPPPHGWRKALLAGKPIPQPNHSGKCKTSLEYSKPAFNADAHVLLRKVVVAVINSGQVSILKDLIPEITAYFNGIRAEAPPAEPHQSLAEFHGIPFDV